MLAGAAGVMHFVIGRFSNYHSMQALGSTLSTPIQQLGTVASLFCAVTILGESLTGLNIFGIVLVSIGPALLIMQGDGDMRQAKSDTTFVPDLKRGILHGMICVVGYGGSPILIVYGVAKRQRIGLRREVRSRPIWQEGHLLIHQLFCYFPIFLPRPAWSSWA